MKRYLKNTLILFSFVLLLSSCEEWLTEPSPGVTALSDYFSTGQTAINVTNAAYVPLTWEYNSTYYSEFFIGDVVSDDALKGGQNVNDMADAYDMENFKTIANNGLLLDYYRAQYQGIARCNLGLREIENVQPDDIMTAEVKDRLLGELKFLRAMYYFRLVRVFGGVPLVDYVLEDSEDWKKTRASVDAIYTLIISDLEDAESLLWLKSEYSVEDLGRATKGAAQAMLLKVNLYRKDYPQAVIWGELITSSGEYGLISEYADNFTEAGENGLESVFEVQYAETSTSDYGDGNGFSNGTFSVILTRSRSSLLGGGWGFNKPTQNLYDEYEVNDPRRDATILNPSDEEIENPEQEIYLGSRYLNRKSGMYDADGNAIELAHPSRGPLNRKDIRYADVLLMYAEAACESGDLPTAKDALEQVRFRARQGSTTILPSFPAYNSYTDTQADLLKAIRHERRVELAMEGHRWYDICRWGVAKEIMDAYKATETPEAQAEMAEFIKGKHELFPFPSKEMVLNEMNEEDQNNGY